MGGLHYSSSSFSSPYWSRMMLESAAGRHLVMLLWNLINTILGLVALGIAIWGAAREESELFVCEGKDHYRCP